MPERTHPSAHKIFAAYRLLCSGRVELARELLGEVCDRYVGNGKLSEFDHAEIDRMVESRRPGGKREYS